MQILNKHPAEKGGFGSSPQRVLSGQGLKQWLT
jgi:hypothetical protein